MNKKDAYIIAGLIVIAIVGGMVLHAYISSKLAVQGATDYQKMSEQVIKQAQDKLDASIAALEAKKNSATTPAQQAQVIREYMPYVIPQVSNVKPSGEISSGDSGVVLKPSPQPTNGTLPDAPSALVIPRQSYPQFLAEITACREDAAKLDKCVNTDVPQLQEQVKKFKTAAKGGGFWSRLRANAKWFAVGGAIGAGAAYAAHH